MADEDLAAEQAEYIKHHAGQAEYMKRLEGGNAVDVSAESIKSEWDRIVIEHEAGAIPGISTGDDGAVKFEHAAPAAPGVAMADKIKMASIVIQGGLKFAFGAIGGLEIEESKYKALADSYGALIAKHYQGGIFEFLAVWREELAAAGATLAFIGAVRSGVAMKRAKAADEVLASGGKDGHTIKA